MTERKENRRRWADLPLLVVMAFFLATVEAAPQGIMSWDFDYITIEQCRGVSEGVDSMVSAGELKTPPSSASADYRMLASWWEGMTYAHGRSITCALLVYHRCIYDRRAPEIRLLDRQGRPLARCTAKAGYEPQG